ncbi:MAG: SDR family oxidoreductase [Microscillaceae bacterium]|nr:SDR family oxidoreductase [Microscillaceae bacterium]MDW8460833.1 SDR family oxidoreductase [Cytophagales bacterium]
MLKVLVTGANGLLGQKLVHLLAQQPNVQLIATAKGENRLYSFPNNALYHTLDVTQETQIAQVFEQYQPNTIIHTAAMTQVDDCEMQRERCLLFNVTAVEYLLKYAEKYQTHFIHLSTDFIFDGKTGLYTEEAEPNPLSFYGESKLLSEKLVQNCHTDWAIVRTVLVYGIVEAMSRTNIILWVKKSLEEGKTIHVVDDQWRTPTLAEDLAMGCWLIAKQRAKGIFNIAGKDLLTPYNMAIATADFFNLDKSLIIRTDSSQFKQPAVRPLRTGLDIRKAQQLLGYQPHSFKEGIALLQKQITSITSSRLFSHKN